jgi:hypothetical protein
LTAQKSLFCLVKKLLKTDLENLSERVYTPAMKARRAKNIAILNIFEDFAGFLRVRIW